MSEITRKDKNSIKFQPFRITPFNCLRLRHTPEKCRYKDSSQSLHSSSFPPPPTHPPSNKTKVGNEAFNVQAQRFKGYRFFYSELLLYGGKIVHWFFQVTAANGQVDWLSECVSRLKKNQSISVPLNRKTFI